MFALNFVAAGPIVYEEPKVYSLIKGYGAPKP